jgi:hypothetical protein
MTTNQISGTVTTGVTIGSASYASSVTVTATGHVSNSTAGSPGIYVPTGDTVVNQGAVTGGSGPNRTDPGGAGVALGTNATLTNSGTITGGTGSNVVGDTHGGPGGLGVSLVSGDSAANSGLIEGGTGGNGHYGGYGAAGGGGVSLTGGTFTNTGRIIGGNAGANIYNPASSGGFGVYLGGGTLINAGTIGGGTGSNAVPAHGILAGANGDAIQFGTVAARLVIDPGAVFNGIVAGNAAVNDVLELASSASAGTLSGLGSEYTGLTTVTIDSAATWDIAGSASGFAGVTIAGFGVNDKIDILNVAYGAGETATLSASDVLTIFNAGGTSLAAVQLSGDLANHAFSVSGNAGHVQISEHVQRPFSEINDTYAAGISLISASYTSTVTITGTAHIAGSKGAGSLAASVYATTAWTIDNFGKVSGSVSGIELAAGGSIGNAVGGTITATPASLPTFTAGVLVLGAPATIDNAGSIGGGNVGVRLRAGGTVTNEASGQISGQSSGVRIDTVAATVENFGSIQGGLCGVGLYGDGTLENTGSIGGTNAYSFGVLVQAGGFISNGATGTITGGNRGVFLEGYNTGAVTLENAGTIAGGSGVAVKFQQGIVNRLIIDPGAVFNGAVTANNHGSNTIELASSASAGTLSGLGSEYVGFQTVTIDTGGDWDIAGSASSFTGVTIAGLGPNDTLDITDVAYAGGDTATLSASDVLKILNAGGTTLASVHLSGGFANRAFSVSNSYGHLKVTEQIAAITGTYAGGIALSSTRYTNPITITSIANISGSTGPSPNDGAIRATSTWTIDNFGTVSGADNGIMLAAGGSVANEAGGAIAGITNGIKVSGGAGTIDNAGTIITNNSRGHQGVRLDAGGTVTNQAGGIISGEYGIGVAGVGTVENAGTISGFNASVLFYSAGANRLIVDAGAVFDSEVLALSGTMNTIELTAKDGAGTLSGLGTEYVGFRTLTIDSGATWDIAGTVAGIDGTTIAGFTGSDRLDVTDLNFAAGDTVSLDRTTDVLTVKGAGLTVLGTVALSGDFTGDFFHLASDGTTGTFITENTIPCYLRGTRIRTSTGDRPVEELEIGDLVETADGKALPLKWIGRRSYRDWLAVGNEDVQPILFKAGSIANHVPRRDLYVSPEHAMFLDGLLIPAHLLVNGASIVKIEGLEEIEYFHLEFDRHVVIFAESAAAESFVDDDSRMLFHNADEYRRLYPHEQARLSAEFCAPRVEAGPALEMLRRRLGGRASRLRADGTAAPPRRRGFVDRATRTTIEGWALPESGPAVLAILVNGAVVGHAVADRYRADIEDVGIGDGRCAFRFDLPRPLAGDTGHCIEVRHEDDWSLLHHGRVTLRPSSG